MSDKLLLLFGDWFFIEAEGTTAILAAGIITGYVGLLSVVALFARSRRTNYTDHRAHDGLNSSISIDQRK
jgi:hypothetical protein